MPLLELVRTALINGGVAVTGWPCYIGYMPDDIGADQCINLTPTGGFAQDTLQGENLRQTFQIYIRAKTLDYSACYAKWKAIYDALENDIAGINLLQPMATGPMQFNDAKNRTCMSINYMAVLPK